MDLSSKKKRRNSSDIKKNNNNKKNWKYSLYHNNRRPDAAPGFKVVPLTRRNVESFDTEQKADEARYPDRSVRQSKECRVETWLGSVDS